MPKGRGLMISRASGSPVAWSKEILIMLSPRLRAFWRSTRKTRIPRTNKATMSSLLHSFGLLSKTRHNRPMLVLMWAAQTHLLSHIMLSSCSSRTLCQRSSWMTISSAYRAASAFFDFFWNIMIPKSVTSFQMQESRRNYTQPAGSSPSLPINVNTLTLSVNYGLEWSKTKTTSSSSHSLLLWLCIIATELCQARGQTFPNACQVWQ